MLPFAYYILKVIICSAVLYGYYWFFLRNKIFHSYNRFYLLASILLSLTLPLLKFNVWQKADAPATSVVHMLQVVNNSDEYMDEIIVQSHYDHISKEEVAMWIFVTICIAFAGIFTWTIIKIYSLKKNNPLQISNDISLVYTEDKKTPFSFLKNIFWNNGIDINSDNGKRILKHEVVHVQEKHSHDKLFINVVLIFFWCNPILWLIRRELNMIHEFIADKKAVEDGDTAAFAAMILQATYPGHRFELANNFFYSPIKRRLAMLTKNKTKVSYISRLLVLPLALIVFAAFTLKAKTYITSLPKVKTITVVIDAGHGGTDNGAEAPDGTFEKDLVLSLAKKIKELNKSENINILLTRETDIYQDPKEKAELAKRLGADLFISVHIDNAPNNETTGFTAWVAKNEFKNTEASKLFAASIITEFVKNYPLRVAENPLQRQKGIQVLQQASCPAVLIEAGYISNKKDLAYLQSTGGKEQFAKNVLNAITSFLAGKKSAEVSLSRTADTTPINKNATTANLPVALKQLDVPVSNSRMKKDTTLFTYIDGKDQVALERLINMPANEGHTLLYFINGKEVEQAAVQEMGTSRIDHAKLIFSAGATAKYGEKGKYGAAEIVLKKDPSLSLSGIASVRVDINRIKEIKELTLDDAEYKIVSATVWINGPSFRVVQTVSINSASLKPCEKYLDKIIPGCAITFVNTRIAKKDGSGEMKIDDKMFLFYDKNIESSKNVDGAQRSVYKSIGINLSGITDHRIHISKLKDIKELKCNDPEYKITYATVYFSGEGFPYVAQTSIYEGSLNSLGSFMNKIVPGSILTFDNVYISKKDGSDKIEVEGKSFGFYDKDIAGGIINR